MNNNSLNDLKYDLPANWISTRREKDKGRYTWDSLRLAGKSDEAGLMAFLERQIEDNDWPEDLTPEIWKELVAREEQNEKDNILRQQVNLQASLTRGEISHFTVPAAPFSTWQLYKQRLKDKGYSAQSIHDIEQSALDTLRNLRTDTSKEEPVQGLIIGNVQSGKTANMAALMAMAGDYGWNFFIVLSGTIEKLRKQTEKRLFNDLHNLSPRQNLNWQILEHLSKKSRLGDRLVDLGSNLASNEYRYMTVCLKNKNRLKDLINWMQASKDVAAKLKVLVIDDEADQAGINTADMSGPEEKERKTINNLIINLIRTRTAASTSRNVKEFGGHYGAMNYMCYTATPYANCLNENGPDSLYPRDYIHALGVSDSYIGPDQIFSSGDSEKPTMDIVRIIPPEQIKMLKTQEGDEFSQIPQTLKDALAWFVCCVAVGSVYNYRKPLSMLINASVRMDDHKYFSKLVEGWFARTPDQIIRECRKIYERETARFTKPDFHEACPAYEHADEEIWDYPSFEKLEPWIRRLSDGIKTIRMDEEGELNYDRQIHLCVDNSANGHVEEDGTYWRLAYPEEEKLKDIDFTPAFIVIGGNTMSRGLTLEGLVSTYFPRYVSVGDSLMQMGRWFGFRPHYELLPRIWMTEDAVEKFASLTETDRHLRMQLAEMSRLGRNPEDFELIFK